MVCTNGSLLKHRHYAHREVLGGHPEDEVGSCTFFGRKNFLATMTPQTSPAIAMTTPNEGSRERSTIESIRTKSFQN